MICSAILSLLVIAGSAAWLYTSRESLSAEVREAALAECDRDNDADACRSRVERLHDDCYRWSLVRHDEHPEIDREKYQTCLKHPPGQFRR
jgi:hypothetical protein